MLKEQLPMRYVNQSNVYDLASVQGLYKNIH